MEREMTEFKSDARRIPCRRQSVYDALSNMENLAKVKDRIPEDRWKDLSFDKDSCSFLVQPFGLLRMVIVDRKEPQTLRLALEKAPVEASVDIELLEEGEEATEIRLTVAADLNPFIKPMVSKPLQRGLDRIADLLATLPYDEL
jgi:hypothetical protein